jgi:hypothetical protein
MQYNWADNREKDGNRQADRYMHKQPRVQLVPNPRSV